MHRVSIHAGALMMVPVLSGLSRLSPATAACDPLHGALWSMQCASRHGLPSANLGNATVLGLPAENLVMGALRSAAVGLHPHLPDSSGRSNVDSI